MLNVMPEPKKIFSKKGIYKLSQGMRIFTGAENLSYAMKISRECKTIAVFSPGVETLENNENLLILAKEPKVSGIPKSKINKKEGYELRIDNDRIAISSYDKAGMFYGIQTLLQIFEDSNNGCLPQCIIRDWPDMAMRGVHFDLKGNMPKFSYLKKAIRRLAKYKINTILIEYEDKLVYKKHPILSAKSSLTIAQAKELDRLAMDNHIEIIPLVQCLGHAEYILKHQEYKHLRETNDRIQQMCPSNPKTMEFFKEICAELFEIHPNSRYFHIGGDETRQLGECRECSQKAKKQGKYKLYFDYVKKACEFIIKNGKIPIVWDDILTRHAPELLAQLPEETIIMYWLYDIKEPYLNFCYEKGVLTSKQWAHKIYDSTEALPPGATNFFEDLPKKEYAKFKKYSLSKDFPKHLSSTIFIEMIKDTGHQVAGCSAAHCSADGQVADTERAIPNIRTWASAIKKHNELGVISTAWTRSGGISPVNGIMEGMWYPFLASAEYYWSAQNCAEKKFDLKFCKRFYGLEGLDATDSIWFLRHQNLLPKKELVKRFLSLAKSAPRNKENLRYYAVISRLIRLNEEMKYLPPYYHRMKYALQWDNLISRDIKDFKEYIDSLHRELEDLKKQIRIVYKKRLHPAEIDDCIKSYFEWSEQLITMDFLEGKTK